MVHPPSIFSLKLLSCSFLLALCTLNTNAQIDNVLVTQAKICTGTNFNISFNISNKGNVNSYFTADSEYTIEIGTPTGNGNTFVATNTIATVLKYTAAAYPTSNNSTLNISFNVVMPTTILANTAYVIHVSSINPAEDDNKSFSNTFEVVETPVTVASNSGPYCSGASINLNSTPIPLATYNWTGPNGYTSTAANPIIVNSTSSMSGIYNVTATLNGCTSLVSSTNVIVTDNITWTGTTNTDWNVATNWGCNYVPKPTSNVIIPTGLARYPILNNSVSGICNNLTIQPNASLIITNNTLQVKGSIVNSGTFNVQDGTVSFIGSTPQTIPSNSFFNNQVNNLTINNSAGVTNLGAINIRGILKVTSGNFKTGNNVKLISSSSQTALIDGSGNGSITGNLTMQRLLDPAFGYKLFSTPFQATTVGDFASVVDLTASFETFYDYQENRQITTGVGATGYVPYIDVAGILSPFKGYAVNFGSSNAAKTVELTGVVNNGNQSIALTNNNRTYTKGFNLVGNPYPSPIDWNAPSGWNKSNVDNALYFFTTSGTDQYTGVYTSTVNGAGGSSIIPSMQGFFIHVTDSPTGTYPVNAVLSATNAVRVNNFSAEFVKTQDHQKETLKLSAKFDGSNLKDALLFYFDPSATIEFDSDLDALKLMNTDPSVPNIYCLTSNNTELSINGIPSISGNTESIIPLGLSTNLDSWITISLSNLPESIRSSYIYLIDSEENKIVDLREDTSYRFYNRAGNNKTRFELRFSNTPIAVNSINFEDLFSVDNSHGIVKVKMNLKNGNVGDIKVTTLTGQVIETKFVKNKDVVEISGIKSTGLYLISFYSNEGVYSKKIIIKN